MKPTLLTQLLLLLLSPTAKCEDIRSLEAQYKQSLNTQNTTHYQERYRRGGKGMIIGGAMIVVGSACIVGSISNPNSTGAGVRVGYPLVVAGGLYFIISGIVYLYDVSKGRPKRPKPPRLSVIGNENEMGLAYNF